MDSLLTAMDELYLDNIDEFINDQNKVVTYKWLSLTLGVHVNLAKQMLFHYLDKRRKESSAPLHATYLVSGKFVENGNTSHKVSVVREDQLEHVKSKMSLTVSVHVYSVQKASLKDSSPLYSVDYDAVKDNLNICSKFSAIKCASAVPMSPSEVPQAHETASTSRSESENARPKANGSASAVAIAKPVAKQPKGIMGMFSKSVAKNQVSTKEAKVEPKEEATVVEESKSRPASKTSAMSNFFGKQPQMKKVDSAVTEEVGRGQSPSSLAEKRPPSPPLVVVKEKDTKKERPEQAAVDKDIRSKTKRQENSDSEEGGKTEHLKKKRRRIKKPQIDSSDDEVITESPCLQDARNPSPIPDEEVKMAEVYTNLQQHSEGQRSSGKSRKRRRVLKSNTFVDEDGCMVTEKCYESESYSETEDVVNASKPPPKNQIVAKSTVKKEPEKKAPKKAIKKANSSSKQATIMGFFHKK